MAHTQPEEEIEAMKRAMAEERRIVAEERRILIEQVEAMKREMAEERRINEEKKRDLERKLIALDPQKRDVDTTPCLSRVALPEVDPVGIWKTLFEGQYNNNIGPGGEAFNKWLRSAVTQCLQSEFHSPTLSVVQSSGCGKSRLIREAADTNPLIYVCCAPPSRLCFPPPIKEPLLRGILSLDTLASLGSGSAFLARLLSLGILYRKNNPTARPADFFSFQAFKHTEMMSLSQSSEFQRLCSENIEYLIDTFLELWGMNTLVHEKPCQRGLPLTIVLDEAGEIFGGGSEAFRQVRGALKEVWQEARKRMEPRICLVFLDTHSRVSNFSPLQHKDSSLRPVLGTGYKLYPPLWFTCNPVGALSASQPLHVKRFVAQMLPSNFLASKDLRHELDLLCGFIAFSHVAGIVSEISRDLLLIGLRSNVAISAQDSQPAWDLCIPLVNTKQTDQTLSPAMMSGIFIQVKNRDISSIQRERITEKSDMTHRGTFIDGEHRLSSDEKNSLKWGIQVLEKLLIRVRRFKPPLLLLFSMQLRGGAGWFGRLGNGRTGTCLGIICNPIEAGHMSEDEKQACHRFCADPKGNIALRIFKQTISDYSIDPLIAEFGEKMLSNVFDPLGARLRNLG